MSKIYTVTGLVALFLLGAGGCQRQPPAPPAKSVGVINLEQVAKAIGHDKIIQKRLVELSKKTDQQLENLKKQFQKQLNDKRQAMPKKLTPDQQKTLTTLTTKLEQQYRQAFNRAQQMKATTQAQLVGEFRSKIEPIVKQIARQDGLGVVLAQNDLIVSTDPVCDITLKVIDQLKSTGTMTPSNALLPPKPPAPPAHPTPPTGATSKPTPAASGNSR